MWIESIEGGRGWNGRLDWGFQGFFDERKLKDGGRKGAVGVDWLERERERERDGVWGRRANQRSFDICFLSILDIYWSSFFLSFLVETHL